MTSSNGNIFRFTGHLCAGEFPAKRPVTRTFDVFFDLGLNNDWVSNGEAGDLIRFRAHYDVTVMLGKCSEWQPHKDGKWFRFSHFKTNEWIYNNPSQEKYGPLRRMKYNLELSWALSKMYEKPFLTFNRRVNMMLWMFKQGFLVHWNDKIQSITLKGLSHKYRNAACYTFLTWNCSILMYEST